MFIRIIRGHLAKVNRHVNILQQVGIAPFVPPHPIEAETGFGRFHSMAGHTVRVEELLYLHAIIRTAICITDAGNQR
jgi:hypothetical protein